VAYHEAGLEVWAWTVNDPEDVLRLAEMGVDAIASDRPDILVRTLRPDGEDS
jgi:glycerophosphoryl diester phosphodiesterase